MGVTLESKKGRLAIDMGAGGFNNLRTRVAYLISEDFGKHYETLQNAFYLPEEERHTFFEDFDATTLKFVENGLSKKAISFCMQSDCGGSIGYGGCKDLLKIIGDYDDNVLYGYVGRPDCAKFRDFKAILKECVDLKCNLIWY